MTQVINDITIQDPIPMKLSETYPDILILGGGRTVYEDYFEARKVIPNSHIMCINDIAGQFRCEEIQHAVSLHTPILPAVQALRREKGCLEHVVTHSNICADGVECVWDLQNVGGTSGLFALKIALIMGSRHIILCGIPMDNSGHYFDPPEVNKKVQDVFATRSTKDPWNDMTRSSLVMSRVRSMGGNTALLFGKPTKEWVES